MDIPFNKPVDDYTHLRVEVDYNKGGFGVLGGDDQKRGYYLRVIPMQKHDGFNTITVSLRDNRSFSTCIVEVGRQNKKRLAAINAHLESLDTQPILDLWLAGAYRNLHRHIVGALADTIAPPKTAKKKPAQPAPTSPSNNDSLLTNPRSRLSGACRLQSQGGD